MFIVREIRREVLKSFAEANNQFILKYVSRKTSTTIIYFDGNNVERLMVVPNERILY